MRPVRVVQAAALSGAAALLAAGVWPRAAAAQGSGSAGPGVYTGQVSATGVEYTMDSSPSFFPSITDVIDDRVPAGLSQLSPGIATATGSLLYPGGAGSGPALFCLAATQTGEFCQELNTLLGKVPANGLTWPPNWPFNATAEYPSNGTSSTQTAQLSGKSAGPGTFGVAEAEASATTAYTSATAAASGVGQVSAGSSEAVTSQYVQNGEFITEGVSVVHSVDIAGVVHIGTVEVTVEVANDGQGHISYPQRAVYLGDTTVTLPGPLGTAGQFAAQIGPDGVCVLASADHCEPAGSTLQALLDKALAAQGVQVTAPAITTTGAAPHVVVDATGLVVNFSRPVTGVPDPLSSVPVCFPSASDCILSPPNPNAVYFGSTLIGQVSADNYAAPTPSFGGGFGNGGLGGFLPGTPGSSGSAGVPATHVFVPGTPGSAGTPGSPALPGRATSAGVPNGSPPELAGGGSGSRSQLEAVLSGTAGRLALLFPAFLLAGVGVLASRVTRAPARLPGAGSSTAGPSGPG